MKKQVAKKNIILLVLISCLSFMNASCIYLVVGGVGALGGYIVSPDTVEGLAKVDKETVWASTVDIISIMGLIEEQYEEGGMIKALINKSQVTITITPVNEGTMKVSVKARKYHFPRINLAQEIYVKIMSSVAE